MKDKISRQSKGVAFVLFLNRDEANLCVKSTNEVQVMKVICLFLLGKTKYKINVLDVWTNNKKFYCYR